MLAALLMPGAPAAAQDALSLLFGMETAYARVTEYTARFLRQEIVGGVLRPREEALLKYQRPGRIYLHWISGPPRGREILFVKGRDDDQMLVREPGMLSVLFTIVMAPDHPRVLQESRYPVTDVGIGRLIELVLENARHARASGGLSVLGGNVAGDGECRIEVVFPRERSDRYCCSRVALQVDVGSGLPVGVTIYDWESRSVAEYGYRDLRVNPGFTASDFDPNEYGFPRPRLHK